MKEFPTTNERMDEPAFNFIEEISLIADGVWNHLHPERSPQPWEEEMLASDLFKWLSEIDNFKKVRKEVDIMETYCLPDDWRNEFPSLEKIIEYFTDGPDVSKYFE